MKRQNIYILCGVLTTLAILAVYRWQESATPAKPSIPGGGKPPNVKPIPPMTAADIQSVKENAWKKAAVRIAEADKAAEQQIDRSLDDMIGVYFAECKKNAKPFAADMLGLRAKWALVRSRLPWGDKDAHVKLLLVQFEKHFFPGEDIGKLLQATVESYLAALDGMDNQLLVNLRADIEDLHPGAFVAIPEAHSDIAFREAYGTARTLITPMLQADLPAFAAREVVSFVGGNIASQMAVRVAAGIATRLGISAGILGTGAAASVGTFGLSVVACFLVDQLIDRIMKGFGYDPEQALADRVCQILDGVRDALIKGHPEAVGVHAIAGKLAVESVDSAVRAEALKTVQILENGGALGLRRDLAEYTKVRCAQRYAALKQLLMGASPAQGAVQ